MLADLSIGVFLSRTASGTPIPGGGSVSALLGASAASLLEMVANLTIGKKGYEAVEEEMKAGAEKAARLREKLIRDIDRDSDAYRQVLSAFGMPRETEAEKKLRQNAVQEAFRHAAGVPMEVAEEAVELLRIALEMVRKGNRNAASDALVGVLCARSAALGALFNVKINLKSITDRDLAADLTQRADKLESEALALEKEAISTA